MKKTLLELYNAGIRKAQFSATFQLKGRNGYVGLIDVQTPIGTVEHHVWIERGHWRGRVPRKGTQISFMATVEPYQHEDGQGDIGLHNVVLLR